MSPVAVANDPFDIILPVPDSYVRRFVVVHPVPVRVPVPLSDFYYSVDVPAGVPQTPPDTSGRAAGELTATLHPVVAASLDTVSPWGQRREPPLSRGCKSRS